MTIADIDIIIIILREKMWLRCWFMDVRGKENALVG
jgi:hypothetical protein